MSRRFDAILAEPDEDEGFASWSGPEQIPISDADREQVNGSWLDDARDAALGFSQGALAGGGDELIGLVRGEDGRDHVRASEHRAQERSPWLYGSMQVLGSLPRNLVGGVWGAIGQGAVEGALSSDAPDALGRLKGAGAGAAMGGALHGAGSAAAAVGGKVGGALRKAGVSQRRASAGGSADELNALREERGIDFMEEGLDRRFDELGLASSPWPQSASDVYRKIGPESGQSGLLKAAGEREGAAIDAAEAMGARGDWGSVRQSIDNEARGMLRRAPVPSDQTQAMVGHLRRIEESIPYTPRATPRDLDVADPVIDAGPLVRPMSGSPASARHAQWTDDHAAQVVDEFPESALARDPGYNPNAATPRELHRQKMEFERAGRYPEGAVAPPSEAIAAKANRVGANAMRAELDDAMRQAGPDIHRAFDAARGDYRDLSALSAMAGRRAAQNKAESMLSNPWTYGSGAAGAAFGAATGGPMGALLGAGLGGALGRRYGQDVAGLGLMGAGHAARGLGNLAEFGANAAKSPAVQGAAGGASLADVAMGALQSDPQQLGPYASQFAEAMASPEPGAVSALITRLIQTDPQFRTQILPQLRAAAGGDR